MTTRPYFFIAGVALSVVLAGCGGGSQADSATSGTATEPTLESMSESMSESTSDSMSEATSESMGDSADDSATADDSVAADTAEASSAESMSQSELTDESAGDAVEPNAELAAEFAAIDELGYCDGTWFSTLAESNTDRPADISEITEGWGCSTTESFVQLLGWASAEEAKANMAPLAASASETGMDPDTFNALLVKDHVYFVGTIESGDTSDVTALKSIQDKIGGEVAPLGELGQ